jgi:hypothetical protein
VQRVDRQRALAQVGGPACPAARVRRSRSPPHQGLTPAARTRGPPRGPPNPAVTVAPDRYSHGAQSPSVPTANNRDGRRGAMATYPLVADAGRDAAIARIARRQLRREDSRWSEAGSASDTAARDVLAHLRRLHGLVADDVWDERTCVHRGLGHSHSLASDRLFESARRPGRWRGATKSRLNLIVSWVCTQLLLSTASSTTGKRDCATRASGACARTKPSPSRGCACACALEASTLGSPEATDLRCCRPGLHDLAGTRAPGNGDPGMNDPRGISTNSSRHYAS